MSNKNIDQQLEKISELKEFDLIIDGIKALLKIDKINVHPASDGHNAPLITVNSLQEGRFESLESLEETGHKIVKIYQNFLYRLLNDPELDAYVCKTDTIFATKILKSLALRYSTKGFHPYTREPNYFLVENNISSPIEYKKLLLNHDSKKYLTKIFGIRHAIYLELATRTELFLTALEYQVFRFSNFKLTKKGEYLITEFILGLEYSNKFLNYKSEEKRGMRERICTFFGLEEWRFNDCVEAIRKRKKEDSDTKALQEMINDMGGAFTYKKKSSK